jgi:hypothetical protein
MAPPQWLGQADRSIPEKAAFQPALSLSCRGLLNYNERPSSDLMEETMKAWLNNIDPGVLIGGVIITAGLVASLVF